MLIYVVRGHRHSHIGGVVSALEEALSESYEENDGEDLFDESDDDEGIPDEDESNTVTAPSYNLRDPVIRCVKVVRNGYDMNVVDRQWPEIAAEVIAKMDDDLFSCLIVSAVNIGSSEFIPFLRKSVSAQGYDPHIIDITVKGDTLSWVGEDGRKEYKKFNTKELYL